MRILLVEPYGTRIGHFGLYASHIGQELSKLGHEVAVVTGTRLDTQQFLRTEPLFRVVEVGLRNSYLSVNSSGVPKLLRTILHGPIVIWFNLVTLSRAVELSARERFDVMHLLDWEAISTAAVLSWRTIAKGQPLPLLVIHVNPVDFTFAVHLRNPLRGIYKLMARWLLRFMIPRFCSVVTVQGEWHRARIRKQLGGNGSGAPPFVIVRPGTSLPRCEVEQAAARRALGLDLDATVFLFFGMLRKDKGIEVLLEAVTGLSGNWQLLIAGAPFDWTPKSLHARVARMRLSERVHTDVRYIPEEEVETYFAAADAVVLPYRDRNYLGNYGPMILACGYSKPLIVSDVGEMGWLVRERRLGYAVRPDDAAALHEALNAFMCLSSAAGAEMAQNARQLAEECSFATMARVLSDIYAGRTQGERLPAELLCGGLER